MAIKKFTSTSVQKLFEQTEKVYAKQTDLKAVEEKVTTLETEVPTAIQTAIAAAGHASYTIAETVPEVADAEENILYLVMNEETGYYDIYALISEEMVRIDDTSIDLNPYSTTEEVNAAIAAAIDEIDLTPYLTEDDFEDFSEDEIAAAYTAAAAAVAE